MIQEILIDSLDNNGRGIGKINGKVVFVENALPKEICKIEIIKEKKNYCEAKVLSYIKTSDKRVTPKCPYYLSCGGCDIEHLDYLDTIAWKKQYLEELFSHAKIYNKPIDIELCDNPWNYRNKLSLKVKDGLIGFYYSSSHNLTEIKECLIARASLNAVIKDFAMYHFMNGELMIRCNENDEILMDLITADEVKIEKEFTKKHKITGILINHKVVYGSSFFFERKNKVLYQVSFDSFFQVNPNMSTKLFSYIKEKNKGAHNVLDLYCGVGTLGLQISKEVRHITGIEIVANAILNAIKNAKLNKVKSCSFHLGKVEDIINKIDFSFDLILLDPPRSGLDKKTLKAIIDIKPKKIIYISCNPITLVRDLKELKNLYAINNVKGFDMFPYTKHVESVVLLQSKD